MPRITSVKQRQLTATAPDQSKERVLASLDPFLRGFQHTIAVFGVEVRDIATQSDGKIIVVGDFFVYNGVLQQFIARLNADLTLDTEFTAGLGGYDDSFNNPPYSIALQSDGKILLGGQFRNLGSTTALYITRLNTDGSVDTDFATNVGTGFDVYDVRRLMLQADGKILVGGAFVQYNGVTQNRITRLNTDATRDTGFTTGSGFNSNVLDMAIQSDGRIVVVGTFTTFDGTTQNRITRLNADGTRQSPGFTVGNAFNSVAWTVKLQADGRILVGGGFTDFDGGTVGRIVRLETAGNIDATFYTNSGTGFNNTVRSIALQSDGKILVGGSFTAYDGVTVGRIARLNTDGTLDTSFDTGTGFNAGEVLAIEPQSDGTILVSGSFTACDGTTQNRMTRLTSSGSIVLPTLPVATYAVASAANNTDEGSALTVNVTTANIRNGTVLRWRILDRPEDFTVDTGLVTVASNAVSFTVTPIADLTTEGSETFRVQLEKLSGTVLAVTGNITINDTSLTP